MSEPETWDELFEALDERPCTEWQEYLVKHEAISSALLGLPDETWTNSIAPYNARAWLDNVLEWESARGALACAAFDGLPYLARSGPVPRHVVRRLRFTKSECRDLVRHIKRLLAERAA